MSKSTIFTQTDKATSGSFNGLYVWSLAGNWNSGLPINGDTATIGGSNNVADINNFSSGSLTLNAATLDSGDVTTLFGTLDITALTINSGVVIESRSGSGVATSDLVIGALSGAGATIEAALSGATVDIAAATDPGEVYNVYDGAKIIFDTAAVPSGTASSLTFGTGGGTFAFKQPEQVGTSSTYDINTPIFGVAVGDTFELPSGAVSSVSFGSSTISVTAASGTYVFTDVSYADIPTGFSSSADAATGLEAITLAPPPDEFQDKAAVVIDNSIAFDWASSVNWTTGAVPTNGGTVGLSANNVDDIASLSLNTADLLTGNVTTVYGTLVVGKLLVARGAVIEARAFSGNPTSDLVVNGLVGAGAIIEASVTGATVEIAAAVDPGETYAVYFGGEIIFDTASVPAGTASTLTFGGAGGMFAFKTPAQVGTSSTYDINTPITGVTAGDTLELPSGNATAVTFGTGTITVANGNTDYVFTDVTYNTEPLGFYQFADAATGLQAIVFTAAPNTSFQQSEKAISGAFTGDYVWSDANNWTAGVPQSGAAVTVTVNGSNVDDLASLSLAAATFGQSDTTTVAGTLDVGSLTAGGASITASTAFGNATADLVASNLSGSGSIINATGTGATVEVAPSLNINDNFEAYAGGTVIFDTASVPAGNTANMLYDNAKVSSGTFAFNALTPAVPGGSTYDINLNVYGVGAGDTLELPSGTVASVSFSASASGAAPGTIDVIAANGNDYVFTHIYGYGQTPPKSFNQLADSATGLQAIVLTGAPNTSFQEQDQITSGAYSGLYLWSDNNNWTAKAPAPGAAVTLDTAHNADDIASLSLAAATLGASDQTVVSGQLSIGSLSLDAGSVISATTAYGGTAPKLTVSTLSGSGIIHSDGAGATVDIAAATVPGEIYDAFGGLVIFDTAAVPAGSASTLGFGTTNGIGGDFAFRMPAELGSTNTYDINAQLLNVTAGDTVELPSGAVSSVSFGASTISIQASSGNDYVFTDVIYKGGVPPTGYTAGADAATGLEAITFTAPACYAHGTAIATPGGDVAVEALKIGDLVLTHGGAARPIKWLGRRSYGGRFIAGNRDVLPIRIAAGALGGGLPRRDLTISPRHAMFLDGVLVPAELLVNGTSIVQIENIDHVAYIHIELDSHDVILAEGAPSETFVDCDSRGIFHNAHEYAELYPGRNAGAWRFCAPRLDTGPALRRLLRRRGNLAPPGMPGKLIGALDHADRSGVRGWAHDPTRPGRAVELDVLVEGRIVARGLARQYRRDLDAAGYAGGRCGFDLRFAAPLTSRRAQLLLVRRADDAASLPDGTLLLPARPGPRVVRRNLAALLRTAPALLPPEALPDAIAHALADAAPCAAPARRNAAWAS